MKLKKLFPLLILGVVLALALAACQPAAEEPAEEEEAPAEEEEAEEEPAEEHEMTEEEMAEMEPIVIGTSLPLTGNFAIAGTKHGEGYQLCVDLANERGGVLGGHQLELIATDNASDTETAIAQTERLINEEQVDLLFGTFSSLLTYPTSGIAAQYGYVYPIPSGAAIRIYEQGYDNLFYWQQSAAELVGSSVVETLSSLSTEGLPASAAVVHADDFFANAIATGLLGQEVISPADGSVVMDLAPGFLVDAGIEVVYSEQWPEEGFSDWVTLANSIKSSGAEMVLGMTASPEEAIQLSNAMATVDYQPKAVYLSQGTQREYQEALGDAAEGVMIHSAWHELANYEGTFLGEPYSNQDFIDDYTAAFGVPPDEDNAIPFSLCQGMLQAVEGAGSTDQAAIRDWLAARTADDAVQTIMGTFYWNEKGLPIGRTFIMTQWQGGELKFVYPVGEFAGTSDLIYPKPDW